MPIIEEIVDEDIDNMDFDPADFDSHNPFDKNTPVEGLDLRPAAAAPKAAPAPAPAQTHTPLAFKGPDNDDIDMESLRQAMEQGGGNRELPEHMKSWKVLYPIYFDAKRSSSDGRRVTKADAVENPLCTRIIEAAQAAGYEAALEVTKTHPKDWANPGRVRVNASVPKRQLYAKIAEFLRRTPTTANNASQQMYKQFASFDSVHPLAVPTGMHINHILPGISPALSAQKAISQSMDMGNMSKMFGGK